jgi:hypothetical protein
LSGEGFRKVDDGLKLLELNLRRLVDKYQHLAQSIQYLGDDIAIFQNNLKVVSTLFDDLKDTREKAKKKDVNSGDSATTQEAK